MENEIIYNANLHFEHEIWERELNFWQDELRSFRLRLEELTDRLTKKEVVRKIEKFQREFEVQEKEIHALKDQIAMHELNMSAHFEKQEDVLNKTFVSQHIQFRNVLERERLLYQTLKKEFFNFLTKYM